MVGETLTMGQNLETVKIDTMNDGHLFTPVSGD